MMIYMNVGTWFVSYPIYAALILSFYKSASNNIALNTAYPLSFFGIRQMTEYIGSQKTFIFYPFEKVERKFPLSRLRIVEDYVELLERVKGGYNAIISATATYYVFSPPHASQNENHRAQCRLVIGNLIKEKIAEHVGGGDPEKLDTGKDKIMDKISSLLEKDIQTFSGYGDNKVPLIKTLGIEVTDIRVYDIHMDAAYSKVATAKADATKLGEALLEKTNFDGQAAIKKATFDGQALIEKTKAEKSANVIKAETIKNMVAEIEKSGASNVEATKIAQRALDILNDSPITIYDPDKAFENIAKTLSNPTVSKEIAADIVNDILRKGGILKKGK